MPLLNTLPKHTEVLIVGSGPAGIAAAHALNQQGVADVLLLDAREKIGHPLRCAEMTRWSYLENFGVRFQPGWLRKTPFDLGIYMNTQFDENHQPSQRFLYPFEERWVLLDRQKSEYEASRLLADKGVNVLEHASVNGVGPWDGRGRTVSVVYQGQVQQLKARFILAADGPSSMVARYAGLTHGLSLNEVISCYEYELSNTGPLNPAHSEMFFYPELHPFYFWIFPQAVDRANVGLEVHGYRGHLAKPLLDRILQRFPMFHNSHIKKHIAAFIPSAHPFTPYTDGMIAVGGAARLTETISGEGLWAAVVSGKRAAEHYLEVRHQSPTSLRLSGYMHKVHTLYDDQSADFFTRMSIERG